MEAAERGAYGRRLRTAFGASLRPFLPRYCERMLCKTTPCVKPSSHTLSSLCCDVAVVKMHACASSLPGIGPSWRCILQRSSLDSFIPMEVPCKSFQGEPRAACRDRPCNLTSKCHHPGFSDHHVVAVPRRAASAAAFSASMLATSSSTSASLRNRRPAHASQHATSDLHQH